MNRPLPWSARSARILARAALALACLNSTPSPAAPASPANVGAEVIRYQPGSGAAAGYDLTASILGAPSQFTPGEFGGPVDPFSAPWQAEQILSLGAGGSVTLRLASSVLDLPTHPYGIDFQIFGASAFVIVNGDFTGGGVTDGSLFGDNPGQTRVSVSRDGIAFFTLDPARSPVVDGLYPTDGQGDAERVVDPSLRGADFAGRDLAGIRSLYGGAAGGVGFDLAWARDADGSPVVLDQVDFIRIDVLSGRSEIDAVVGVPEPGVGSLFALGGVLWLIRRRGGRPLPGPAAERRTTASAPRR